MSNQDGGLALDFSWLMKANADHYSFYERGIPTLFLHTDLHERYHKPTDVAAKVNREGMERVGRLAFAILYAMADDPAAPRFRPAAKAENEEGAAAWKPPNQLHSGPVIRRCGWAFPGGPTTPSPIP